MTMRHKEFLIAFAEGKPVECRYLDGSGDGWHPVLGTGSIGVFDAEHLEFRIKPRTIKVQRWVTLYTDPRLPGAVCEDTFESKGDACRNAELRESRSYKVLAAAVHLCTEVEVQA